MAADIIQGNVENNHLCNTSADINEVIMSLNNCINYAESLLSIEVLILRNIRENVIIQSIQQMYTN